VIHAVEKPEHLNTSTLEWFDALYKNSKDDERVVASASSWVDVRDIAEAHVVALEKPEAGGERILFSTGRHSLPPHVIQKLKVLVCIFRAVHLARF
jgi:nucleoside-diphosphate-sugar epimerase